MDRATFESQKAFAGEKKPSMQRRCVDNDYTARRMYMVTMVTEERKPLFGKVVGRSEAVEPSADAPHIELSTLGQTIEHIWLTMGNYHPEVKVIALQMMPDHLHAVLFVKAQMAKPLGKVLLGVKQACNQAFRELMPVQFVAVAQQHALQARSNGLLFAKGFNDQILMREGQLERWLNYLKDNPRRLLMPTPAVLVPFILIERYLVAPRFVVSVPATTGIRQIYYVAEVGVQIRFADDAQRLVVMSSQQLLVIPSAIRRTVCADGLYGIVMAKIVKPYTELLPCLLHVSGA